MKTYETQADFFDMVYQVVRLIPPGRVTSYGAIARYLGSARGARMVGWAMNQCHDKQPPLPAQRVLNRNGMLTGKHHFSTPETMQRLLEAEGLVVEKDVVKDWKKHFWDPSQELAL